MKGSDGKKTGAHPGFEGAAEKVARQKGISKKRGRKIVAAGAQKASAAAKRKNPRLKRVSGA